MIPDRRTTLREALSAAEGGVRGRRAWGAKLGYGSFLTIEFGGRSEESPQHGEWHLWLYGCDWELSREGDVLVTSEFEGREIAQARVDLLNDREVVSIDLGTALTIQFFDDLSLRSEMTLTVGMDQWVLFTPGAEVILCNKDGEMEIENAGY